MDCSVISHGEMCVTNSSLMEDGHHQIEIERINMTNIFLIIHVIIFQFTSIHSSQVLAMLSMNTTGKWNPNSVCCILLSGEGGGKLFSLAWDVAVIRS